VRRRTGGFTLLEAIVAMTILGFALLAAFGWISNNLAALGKVRELALEEAAVMEAIAQLEDTDLQRSPTGSLLWREFRIEWQAVLMEPPATGRSTLGARGLHELALYEVDLAVQRGARQIAAPRIRIVQHRQVREAADSG
jgi:hypothetical protein